MLGRLFLLFTIVPIVELYLLITIGGAVGAPATIGVVAGTGLLGAWLAKKEGARVLRQWQASVNRGELPKEGVTSSLLVLVGGILLVTPGVLTDLFGLEMLIPPSRRFVAGILKRRVQKKLQIQEVPLGLGAAKMGIDDFVDPMYAKERRGDVIDLDADDVVEKNDASTGS